MTSYKPELLAQRDVSIAGICTHLLNSGVRRVAEFGGPAGLQPFGGMAD
jgi:hypothetical protein